MTTRCGAYLDPIFIAVTDIHMDMQPDGYCTYKNIIEVNESSAGVYTCKAANEGNDHDIRLLGILEQNIS